MAHRPRKQFAQHWLTSEAALQQIVRAAALSRRTALTRPDAGAESGDAPTTSVTPEESSPGDRVLEIGPGRGALTRRLLPLAAAVVAVEIDRDLCQLLRQTFATADNFLLLEADILQLDLAATLVDHPTFAQPNKVVANIPYNITGEILMRLLGTIAQPNAHPFDSIVLLVQQEVAQRLCAKPGNKDFGGLTVRVQYLAECEWVCAVPAKAFKPAPKVDSAVVRLTPRLFEPQAIAPAFLDRLVRLGFATRRKMLRNNLQSVVSRDRLEEILHTLAIKPTARAEEISVADWVALSNTLWQEPSPEAVNPAARKED
ncbi:MAG: 16S rRNA (adenine(1518)-N(6)/adenine(1519)-N(6))-dimethyltransferase RsmA [Kaiparowitsia implicata GSE-PSE-MK54-09C]|nr:16S rRNA (adenine(1518)-N(6)/adenine(1519)-N(6))-dimethyltransferase RsmA [Kaiparowitsia implicata GSE-PSE-MK54-09C]